MKEITPISSVLEWTPFELDDEHESGFRTQIVPTWITVPCPLDMSLFELSAPAYPKVPKGETIGHWQLRNSKGFVATRSSAEECMELAALMQMLVDGDDVSLVVAILERLRDRPTTRGKLFFEELLTNVKNLDWAGA